ncbi:hypothetical protein B0H11DRAFT_1673722, partial [Mycena galericulata]
LLQTIRFTSHLKQDILLVQPAGISMEEAPLVLPTITEFIATAIVAKFWESLRHDIWELPAETLSAAEEELFRKHGWKIGISNSLPPYPQSLLNLPLASMTLYPPSHHCTNRACGRSKPLKK